MGFLRKLAELVVEFPEEQQAAAPTESEQDVLASIEAIRGNLEAELGQQPASPMYIAAPGCKPRRKGSTFIPSSAC
jgi:hypothetical protein